MGVNSPEPHAAPSPRAGISLDWPQPSPPSALAARRERLQRRHSATAVLASGWPRARNFPLNQLPFRAESHFLYLVGQQLEGAALVIGPDRTVLYVTPPDPGDRLWHGPEPTAQDLSRLLGLEVRDIAELNALPGAVTLPPQDPRAERWLVGLLGRELRAGGGELAERDAELAEALIDLRLVHDPAAIEQMRQAARVTVTAHAAGMRETRAGQREARVSGVMQAVIAGAGMNLAYAPIVTVEGQVLHARRHDRIMGEADLLLVDVGAETPEGWAADVTRTWPVSGRFSPTQRDLYEAVAHAQAAALSVVRPGARYSDVHAASQRALASCLVDLGILRGSLDALLECHAVALFYPHGVGHLLGLDVHDMEDLGDRAGYAAGRERSPRFGDRYLRLDRDLEPGMAVTIEPGFYNVPGILSDPELVGPLGADLDRDALARFADVRGIRIEDDVVCTAGAPEVMTAACPKTPADIEAVLRG